MSDSNDPLPLQRRESLAAKGRLLYSKFCGTGGRGICAESFAVYHIGRGETSVAVDLLAYLSSIISKLEQSDPNSRLQSTIGLASRIQRHLDEAIDSQGKPNPTHQQTGMALRTFVLESSHAEAEVCEMEQD